MTKRVHYPVNKETLGKIIELWYRMEAGEQGLWDEFYDMCRGMPAYCGTAMCSLVQAMYFSDALTVDHLYYAIIAAGINTRFGGM